MKILFVTNEVPYPPDNGVKIPSFNAMRMMKEAGHNIALAVLTEDTDNLKYRFSYLKKFCTTKNKFYMVLPRRNKVITFIKSIFKRTIYPVERFNDNEFRRKLSALVSEFKPDVIHFDIITMVQYYDIVEGNVAKIASVNDCYSLTLENLFSSNQFSGLNYFYRKFQLMLTRHYESVAYQKFEYVHLMTNIDASYIRSFDSNIQTYVIPNGVNGDLFGLANKNLNANNLLFVAKLVGENIASLKKFIEISWPIIHSVFPSVVLRVAGALGEEAVSLKMKYNGAQGIKFIGYVEKLTDVYTDCGVAIVPINKDCGLINKAIEAMASGLVTVGFEKTFTALDAAVNSTHYMIAADYEEMGRVICQLLENQALSRSIKVNANQYALRKFSWKSRLKDYEDMYTSAIKIRASKS